MPFAAIWRMGAGDAASTIFRATGDSFSISDRGLHFTDDTPAAANQAGPAARRALGARLRHKGRPSMGVFDFVRTACAR